jgi:hypothetical protein
MATSEERVRRIVETVAVGAIIALAAFLALLDPPTNDEWRAAAFFVAFGFMATALAYRTSQATGGNIGFLPWLSFAIISPNAAAPAVVLVSAIAAEVVNRRPPMKAVFNASQQTFAFALGLAAYIALGGTSVLTNAPRLFPFAALVLIYFSLNKLAVSTVVSAAQGGSTGMHWLKSMRGSLVYDVLAIPLVLLFAVTYARLGAGWSAVLALPMLGIRQLYRTVFALQKVNEELLQLMVASIEARDPYTSGHSQRVARYARVIARAAGLSTKVVERTEIAALLHDVGKIHEEFATILRKPGALTDGEFDIMKTHPARSAELVSKVSQFEDLVPAVLSHHEAWNGRGYPNRQQGESIPVGARVIALADTIDAMTTSRPYRDGLTIDEVRDELARQSGRQFDPMICSRLLTPHGWSEFLREMAAATEAHPPILREAEVFVIGRTGEFSASLGR